MPAPAIRCSQVIRKRLRSDGGDLVLVVDHSPIRKIFEVTLLDRAFAIYATRAEALAS